jgi:hypothetical protein
MASMNLRYSLRRSYTGQLEFLTGREEWRIGRVFLLVTD